MTQWLIEEAAGAALELVEARERVKALDDARRELEGEDDQLERLRAMAARAGGRPA